MSTQALEIAIQHHRAGRLADAEAICRQVLGREPAHADALHLLGLIAYQLGKHEEAIGFIRRAVGANGAVPDYYNNLGLACHALMRFDEAVGCFQRALTLNPMIAEVHCNLGRTFSAQGNAEAAMACYQRALELKPGYAEAHSNLGNAFLSQGRLDKAEACFQRALAINPGRAEIHGNLGNVLLRLGRFDDALAAYRRVLSIRPDYAMAYNQMGTAYLFGGMPDQAVDAFRQALAIKPDYAEAYSMQLFTLLNKPCPPAEIFAAHRRFAERYEEPLKPGWRPHPNTPEPERRLKVGYVSPNFHRHSVARFIEPVLARHDREQIEVYCYYTQARIDEVTDRLRASSDRWLQCMGWRDDRLAERIRADGIDILVDLAGHTRDNSLLAFARKPAPVQVSYLGYPATTGLSAMDYRLTTLDIDPASSEAWHSETLHRLPHTPWCYHPPEGDGYAPSTAPALDRGCVTFGSMNTFSKVSSEVLTLWAGILGAVPGSRLVMSNVPAGSPRLAVVDRLASLGIEQQRLSLHHYLPREEFRALQSRIDIALDPFPYNGTTTTCEALWLGIPVIALTGTSSVARSGYALLKLLGLEALTARDKAEYLRIAVELAGDLERLNTLRQGLRARLEASPLRDEAGMTRDLETAYRTMWRSWCASRAERLV